MKSIKGNEEKNLGNVPDESPRPALESAAETIGKFLGQVYALPSAAPRRRVIELRENWDGTFNFHLTIIRLMQSDEIEHHLDIKLEHKDIETMARAAWALETEAT